MNGSSSNSSRQGFLALPWSAWLAWASFLAIAAAGVWLRPAISIGETRYLTVTWNMWLTNNHIVPTLDGVAYGHKPPLLFAIIEQVWDLTGPIESVARLVPPSITAICFLLIASCAKLLWPARSSLAALAPPLLLSFLLFTILGQTLMFDGVLTLFALLSVTGLLLLLRGKTVAGILLFGAGIGLGLLTKGPVILTFTLPIALLYPVWRKPVPESPAPGRWYVRIGAGILLGAGMGLTWVLLAINATGTEFGYEILWRQTAERIVSSFAHQKAWWFYPAALPLIAFPWFFWSGTWNKERWRGALSEWQFKFLVTAAVSPVLIMSLVSAKRLNYMLPLYPLLALMVARLLDAKQPQQRRHVASLAICLTGAGITAIALGYGPKPIPLFIVEGISPWLGPVWMAIGACYWLTQKVTPQLTSEIFAWTRALILAVLILVTQAGLAKLFDRLDAYKVVAAIPDAANVPLAIYGDHLGVFGYTARRRKPVASLGSVEALRQWSGENPDGYLLSQTSRSKDFTVYKPLRVIPFRHFEYGIWKVGCITNELQCK
jgi:4-amino-4-deoxy-L-arabinose transferase-like glycosyltransferase